MLPQIESRHRDFFSLLHWGSAALLCKELTIIHLIHRLCRFMIFFLLHLDSLLKSLQLHTVFVAELFGEGFKLVADFLFLVTLSGGGATY